MKHEREDPITAMTRGYVVTTLLAAAGLYVAVRFLLGDNAWLFAAALIGLVASFVFAAIARYYTSNRYRPVRSIASGLGHRRRDERHRRPGGCARVYGAARAHDLRRAPRLVLLRATRLAERRGRRALRHRGRHDGNALDRRLRPLDGHVRPHHRQRGRHRRDVRGARDVRERTDRLDAAGNTTKALTKGYAIGSAALAAFLLFSAYLDQVTLLGRAKLRALGDPSWASYRFEHVDIGKLSVFIAALIGGAVVFLFSALAIRAVARDANLVIEEVRRQFRENPGIMDRTVKPDYGRCVDIVTVGALRGMIAPGLLAVSAPVVVGVLFKLLATHEDATLGAEAVAAELMVGTIAGVLLALMMNTGGGAWDNAKKLIETGELGGKGSSAHKAAVVGDAVGDPLKDTAGPSLHVLIKLLGTVSLVTAPLFV